VTVLLWRAVEQPSAGVASLRAVARVVVIVLQRAEAVALLEGVASLRAAAWVEVILLQRAEAVAPLEGVASFRVVIILLQRAEAVALLVVLQWKEGAAPLAAEVGPPAAALSTLPQSWARRRRTWAPPPHTQSERRHRRTG